VRPGRAAWTACGPTRAPTGRSWAGSCGTWRGDTDRQFLDIGTGIPKEDNVHEVAQREAPESRLVYVDRDLIVLARADQLRRAAGDDHLYLRGAVVGQDSPACQRVAVTAGFSPAGSVSRVVEASARLSKSCATSSEAGEFVVIAQELGPGG